MIHEGTSVLWTPTRNFGTPTLYEEMEGAPLHPWSWLRSFFSYSARWRLNAVVVLFGITLAHIFISRKIFYFSWPASIVFAQIGALSPFLLRNLNHQYLLTYASVVWLLYFIFSSLKENSTVRRNWLIIFLGETISISTGIVAGFPEAFFPAILITFFVYLAAVVKHRMVVLKSIAVAALSSITALALASFQVLAFFEGLRDLGSEGFRVGMGSVSLPWSDFSQFFIRYDFMHQNLVFYYTGALVLFLLLLAIPLRSWRHANQFIGYGLGISALFFLIHVFNVIPPVHQFIASLPLLNVSNFYGFFPPLLILGVAWLAGSVVEKIFHGQARLSPLRVGCTLVLYISLLSWFSVRSIQEVYDPFELSHLDRLIPAGILLILFFFLTSRQYIRPLKQRVWEKGFAALLVVGIFVELFFSMYQFKYSSAKEVENVQFGEGYEQVVDLLCNRSDRHLYRIMAWDRIMPEFCVAQPDSTASPTPLRRTNLLKQTLFSRSLILEQPYYSYSLPMTSIRWMIGRPQDIQVVQYSGLEYVETLSLPGAWRLIEIPSALPRAYVSQRCQTFDTDQEVVKALQTGDYILGEALIESQDSNLVAWCLVHMNLDPAVRQVDFLQDEGPTIAFHPVQGPGIFVLNDSYYPGWKVYDQISGKELKIVPVNIAFKGVILEEYKEYQLIFKYRPRWLTAAYGLTAGATLTILIVVYIQYKKRKKPRLNEQ